MVRYVLLGSAVLLAGAASLTAVKAPTVAIWMVAILAGEFGHFLVLLPLAVAAWTLKRGSGEARWAYGMTLGLCGVAAGFFTKPAWQASGVARELPVKLERAFGKVALERDAFSVSDLFRAGGERVAAETRVFAFEGTPDALAMDFYRAKTANAKAPCVVVVHGGGWDSGERGQLAALNSFLAQRGFAVAAISYRLAPKHVWPAQRDDVRAAVAYLKTHAAELGVDARRFVLLGRSAGGQIAEAAAYDEPDPAVRGVVALYAPADMEFAWKFTDERDVLDSKTLIRQLTGGTPETVAANFVSASPFLHVKRGTVPTLLMHGTIDSLVWRRQSERLAEKLTSEGVPNVFVELPWGVHAFDYNSRGPGGQLAAFAVEWFLRAVTSSDESRKDQKASE